MGHNNTIKGFRPAAVHPFRLLCFLKAYIRWLHQSMTGLPRFALPRHTSLCSLPTSADFRMKYTRLAGLCFTIRTKCMSQRSLWILIRCTTYMSLRSSYCSLMDRRLKSLPTRTGLKVLQRKVFSLEYSHGCCLSAWECPCFCTFRVIASLNSMATPLLTYSILL